MTTQRRKAARRVDTLIQETAELERQQDSLPAKDEVRKNQIQALLIQKRKEIRDLQAFIDESSKMANKIGITDHAIVQYITRVLGVSRKELEDCVLPEIVRTSPGNMDGRHRVDSHVAVIKDRTVVTVIGEKFTQPPGSKPKKKTWQKLRSAWSSRRAGRAR